MSLRSSIKLWLAHVRAWLDEKYQAVNIWFWHNVNPTHYMFTEMLIAAHVPHVFWVALATGLVHESADGDFFGPGGSRPAPWEGVKDVFWFIAPFVWRIVVVVAPVLLRWLVTPQ